MAAHRVKTTVVKNVGQTETWTIEAEAQGASESPGDLRAAVARATEAVVDELQKRDDQLRKRAGGT